MPLRTPKQLADDEGLSVYQVGRLLEDKRLAFIEIGSRRLIPDGAWEQFLAEETVKPCRDETPGHASASSTSAGAITSFGQSADAAASAALARQTAKQLKSSSRGSCASAGTAQAHVIPLRPS